MPSPDSELKTARMSASTWEIVSREMREWGVTFSGWVKRRAEEGIKNHGDLPEESLGVHPTQSEILSTFEPILDENDGYQKTRGFNEETLGSYAKFFGLSEEELFGKLVEVIDNGVLMYENGCFIGVGNLDTSMFEEKCREQGKRPQTVLDRVVRKM